MHDSPLLGVLESLREGGGPDGPGQSGCIEIRQHRARHTAKLSTGNDKISLTCRRAQPIPGADPDPRPAAEVLQAESA